MRRLSNESRLRQPNASAAELSGKEKPIVVGLYGVQGSGKTYLVNLLKTDHGEDHFTFYDGSQKIDSMVPGGLEAFKCMEDAEKIIWRKQAIDRIGNECADSGKVGVVAGHLMLPSEKEEAFQEMYTDNDLNTYTHILYLEVPPKEIRKRRSQAKRVRPDLSVSQLTEWQDAEKTKLVHLCREHNILFLVVVDGPTLQVQVSTLLRDFRNHNEKYNLAQAESQLDKVLVDSDGQGRRMETMLVLDADGTLSSDDTGILFWKLINDEPVLSNLFTSNLKHSYTGFRQATLLYEGIADEQEYESRCRKIAATVNMHPEMVTFLKKVVDGTRIGAVVITCGLRRVWELVLEKEDFSDTVAVIGGGRISDGFVVTAAVKGALVTRLHEVHHVYVWAFGDSPLDLDMLKKADQAIVVVGEERDRPTKMVKSLIEAIDDNSLRAHQVALPSHVVPRVDKFRLPLFHLTDQDFLQSVCRPHSREPDPFAIHATEKASTKLLMTPSRDTAIAGPALREAHGRIGRYLATEYVADLVGVEDFPIMHVQGYLTTGYRLSHEKETLIVALMRAGDPMALGVGDIFPLAKHLHARNPEDIQPEHLQGLQTIVLVDSVIHTGETVLKFLRRIRDLRPNVRIITVAGVIFSDFLSNAELAGYRNFSLVTLRISENGYTGVGTLRTGNRLFNMTHLP